MRLLGRPKPDRLRAGHLPPALGEVLAVGPTRVLHFAVGNPPVGVVPGVGGDGLVPRERADADLRSDGVVDVHKVLVGVVALWWESLGDQD